VITILRSREVPLENKGVPKGTGLIGLDQNIWSRTLKEEEPTRLMIREGQGIKKCGREPTCSTERGRGGGQIKS